MPKRKRSEPDEAKAYLLRLLRYRPRSRAEAAARLRERGYPLEAISITLSWAEEAGLLDDRAFARLWAAERLAHRPCGTALLRRELREKGVASELIEQTLAELDPDEEGLARALARERWARYQTLTLTEEERRQKVFAFLRRRGFPPDLSLKAVRELMVGAEADADDPLMAD